MVTGKRRSSRFSGEWRTYFLGHLIAPRKERVMPEDVPCSKCIELEHIQQITGKIIGACVSGNQKSLKSVFYRGDILFGKLRPYLRKYALTHFSGVCSTEIWVFNSISKAITLNQFAYYLLQSDWFIAAANSTIGTKMPRADWSQLRYLKVKIPSSVKEQTAIAEVLSDADSLIASLQKLIAKKKAIKQGAMQELLTGKRRLPGVSGKWIKITIGDEQYALIDQNTLPSTTQPGYTFEYITLENVEKGRLLKTIPCKYGTSPSRARRIVKKNDILFGTVRPNLHSHLFIRHECADVVCSTGFCVITCFHNVLDPAFLYFKFYTKEVDSQVEAIISGSNYPALSSSDVKSLKIVIPSNLEEQIAIAQVLSDMDAEIEKLEKKLSKYQKIKQGMMEELLTGKIRLIDATPKQEQQVTIAGKKHNQQFDDAVMIAGIVNAFYSETFPLGRKKVQKLLYLMRRKEKADVSVFHKKAAGPYADSVRYNGGETIAEKRNYIAAQTNGKGTLFRRGAKIGKALGYIQSWGKQASIDWLTSNFQYTRVDDLELFATVDMAICDLRKVHKPISVQTIKEFIQSTKEWRKKLDKSYFSDPNIQRAINKCREFFGEQ